MLHELLLALNGYHGNIFVLSNGRIHLSPGLPFVHPSEEDIFGRLCSLASLYYRLHGFVQRYELQPDTDEPNQLKGVYLQALSCGIDKVLEPYSEALLSLEQQLLGDVYLTAAHVLTSLEPYQLLFPALMSTVDEIEIAKVHGCQILESLHKGAMCGTPIVRRAFLQLLQMCHRVLYNQLLSWLLYGILQDRHSEFFIQPLPPSPTEGGEELEDKTQGVLVPQLQQMLQSLAMADKTARLYDQFTVRMDLLPSYIPNRLADKVLFVGQSVQMFDREGQLSFEERQDSILEGKRQAFCEELMALSRLEEFDLRKCEATVDRIRQHVAQKLRQLVVDEADLIGQLRTMKEFYLLGRGELYLAFIDQADNLLRVPPTTATQHDVNNAFQQAARSVLFEDDDVLHKFRLNIERSKQTTSNREIDFGWSCLKMKCSIVWPLHILFTPSVLDRYNIMFGFLLHVRRVQARLQNCWMEQMLDKRRTTDGQNNQWWLRNHMAFLLDNLQYYLQVDVIESQFSILLEKIEQTQDFEAIRLAHDTFQTSLLAQSFILVKPVFHCLNEMLQLCKDFCGLLSSISDEAGQFQRISLEFQRQSQLLFSILSSVRSQQASPHLAQLLLRLDFNKYYTSSGGQLGCSQVLSK